MLDSLNQEKSTIQFLSYVDHWMLRRSNKEYSCTFVIQIDMQKNDHSSKLWFAWMANWTIDRLTRSLWLPLIALINWQLLQQHKSLKDIWVMGNSLYNFLSILSSFWFFDYKGIDIQITIKTLDLKYKTWPIDIARFNLNLY